MLIFGIVILFAVFAAVIAIFPANKNSTLDLHEDNAGKGGGDDDDDERTRRSDGLVSFPKQVDGRCPAGFRPYFSGCILNMPFPRAVDDSIKDNGVSPCASLNSYACGGWHKHDRDRGSRSFRSAGRWNERLAEYVRKVNGLREPFSWDAASDERSSPPPPQHTSAEEEEVFFHLLTKSCVRSLQSSDTATAPLRTSLTLAGLLDKLATAGKEGNRRSVGVMAGTLAARGIPSVIHLEPVRNPADRSQSVLYMEPWVTIGSDPHYVREILRGDDDAGLRAHMELIDRSCAALAALGRISWSHTVECAKAALSIEAALIGSVQQIPESAAEYLFGGRRRQPSLGRDLVPNGEQAMAEAVDANEYRSGFADGFYDAMVDDMGLTESEADAIRKASIWTLGGLEPFFESGLGVILDTEAVSQWLYYFQVVVLSEASHYLPSPEYNGGARVKALLYGLGTRIKNRGSISGGESLLQARLMPWGRLRRMEPLRGHVTNHALGFVAAAAAATTTKGHKTDAATSDNSGGLIIPYETTRDPSIEESEVWKTCVDTAATYLPEIADDTFSDLVVDDEDRRLVEEVSANVIRALLASVTSSERLSNEAKRLISSKARSIIRRIAKPWKDRPPRHTGLKLRGENFFDDAMAVRSWNTEDSFRTTVLLSLSGTGATDGDEMDDSRHHTSSSHRSSSGGEEDPEKRKQQQQQESPFEDPRFGRAGTRRFEMRADIPNAFFDPTQNVITILPGIMRPPFFDKRYSNASLYATVGAVIGHELSHAFDAQGINFDRYGNLAPGWMPKGDLETYQKAKQCYVDQYDGRKTTNGNKDDGSLTVSENIADGMGLRAAWMALLNSAVTITTTTTPHRVVGADEAAEFLEAYAQMWCTSVPAGSEKDRMSSDPHSPADIRVDGAVQNLRHPETGISPMQLAYGCEPGETTMVPEKTCELW